MVPFLLSTGGDRGEMPNHGDSQQNDLHGTHLVSEDIKNIC